MKWWTPSEPIKKNENVVPTIIVINNIFKKFLTTGSWIIYVITIFLISLGFYYFYQDVNQRKQLLQRRREIRRANEKPPQKRRPGAAARDHEIYRNIMGKVQKYIDPLNCEEFVFRQTRSGTIYGQFIDEQNCDKDMIIENDSGNCDCTSQENYTN